MQEGDDDTSDQPSGQGHDQRSGDGSGRVDVNSSGVSSEGSEASGSSRSWGESVASEALSFSSELSTEHSQGSL